MRWSCTLASLMTLLGLVLASACGRIRFRVENLRTNDAQTDHGDVRDAGFVVDATIDPSPSDSSSPDASPMDAASDARLELSVADVTSTDRNVLDTFPDTGPDATDAPLDVGIDAPDVVEAGIRLPRIDNRLIVKRTPTRPVLDEPLPSSDDCGRWAFSYVPDQPAALGGDERGVAVAYDGTDFWMTYSCKNSDTGWSVGLAKWVRDDYAMGATKYDPNPGVPGIQAIFGIADIAMDGQTLFSMTGHKIIFTDTGSVVGTIWRHDTGAGRSRQYALRATRPENLNASSLDIASVDALLPPLVPTADAGLQPPVWATLTGELELLRVGATTYIYGSHSDGVTRNSRGHLEIAISVARTNDFSSVAYLRAPMVVGWSDPMVSESDGYFHMVARRQDDNRYYYVSSADPTSFDFSNATPLFLHRFVGALGDWDESRYSTHAGSGDPKVAGATVVDSTLYLFYWAGTPNVPAFIYGDAKRGVGVLTVPVTLSPL